MYRIIFDADKAVWVVELCKFALYWKRVKDKEFPTLTDAEKYADQVGLDTAYRRQPTRTRYSGEVAISRGQVPPYPIPQPYAISHSADPNIAPPPPRMSKYA